LKRAIIDLGTNSVLLLIGQAPEPGTINVLQQQYMVSRLGERVFDSGQLSAQAMKRTMVVLDIYAREIKMLGVDQVHLLGTAALRQAGNVEQFRDLIRKQLGWELQVISAEQEAHFSFLGAGETVRDPHKIPVVMDVGGGSTEIIYGQDQLRLEFVSLALGVVELAEQFQMKDQLDDADQLKLRGIIRSRLQSVPFLQKIKAGHVLIGVGGTITTLVAVRKRLAEYDPERINGYVLNKNELRELFQSLNRLTSAQRRRQPGITQGREDVILYGTLIFLEMLDFTGFKSVVASDRGLRFGYFKYIEETERQRDKEVKERH
jgi:exopolyphosphatase/guanosine-5'-triphosphate,3'-diphosphate pyrophosphatase